VRRKRQRRNPFPLRLRQAREALGLSQRVLGIAAGIDPSVASPRINQYERGKHMPDYLTVARMGEALNVPPPFFHAADDDLAEAIRLLGRMSPRERRAALKVLAAEPVRVARTARRPAAKRPAGSRKRK